MHVGVYSLWIQQPRGGRLRVAVRKWGNSLALRIPKALADDSRLVAGTEVDITIDGGRLVVTPVAPTQTLDDLLARITDENRHPEVSTGAPRGGEAW